MIIDGKGIAQNIQQQIKIKTADFVKEHNVKPGLAVIKVGLDSASEIYVNSKKKKAVELGFHSEVLKLPENSSEQEVIEVINRLNANEKFHGILLQLPLPQHLDSNKLINLISPQKDVDGFHPQNIGKLISGESTVVPCTPLGILFLASLQGELSGKNALVIGRSIIVGKPVASLLLEANCTVTIAHSRTKNLKELGQKADIIVAAIGKPQFITADMVNEHATLIDVGINRTADGKIVGDANFDELKNKIKAITPVPGGVGPMTIASLLFNCLLLTKAKVLKQPILSVKEQLEFFKSANNLNYKTIK